MLQHGGAALAGATGPYAWAPSTPSSAHPELNLLPDTETADSLKTEMLFARVASDATSDLCAAAVLRNRNLYSTLAGLRERVDASLREECEHVLQESEPGAGKFLGHVTEFLGQAFEALLEQSCASLNDCQAHAESLARNGAQKLHELLQITVEEHRDQKVADGTHQSMLQLAHERLSLDAADDLQPEEHRSADEQQDKTAQLSLANLKTKRQLLKLHAKCTRAEERCVQTEAILLEQRQQNKLDREEARRSERAVQDSMAILRQKLAQETAQLLRQTENNACLNEIICELRQGRNRNFAGVSVETQTEPDPNHRHPSRRKRVLGDDTASEATDVGTQTLPSQATFDEDGSPQPIQTTKPTSTREQQAIQQLKTVVTGSAGVRALYAAANSRIFTRKLRMRVQRNRATGEETRARQRMAQDQHIERLAHRSDATRPTSPAHPSNDTTQYNPSEDAREDVAGDSLLSGSAQGVVEHVPTLDGTVDAPMGRQQSHVERVATPVYAPQSERRQAQSSSGKQPLDVFRYGDERANFRAASPRKQTVDDDGVFKAVAKRASSPPVHRKGHQATPPKAAKTARCMDGNHLSDLSPRVLCTPGRNVRRVDENTAIAAALRPASGRASRLPQQHATQTRPGPSRARSRAGQVTPTVDQSHRETLTERIQWSGDLVPPMARPTSPRWLLVHSPQQRVAGYLRPPKQHPLDVERLKQLRLVHGQRGAGAGASVGAGAGRESPLPGSACPSPTLFNRRFEKSSFLIAQAST